MKRFMKRFKYGERGFTMVELLVVIAILGILAAVMVPNVSKFIGTGAVQAANTEAKSLRNAVQAVMIDDGLVELEAQDTLNANGVGTYIDVDPFIDGTLEAFYTIDTDGSILSADPTQVENSKWSGLTFNTETLEWEKSE